MPRDDSSGRSAQAPFICVGFVRCWITAIVSLNFIGAARRLSYFSIVFNVALTSQHKAVVVDCPDCWSLRSNVPFIEVFECWTIVLRDCDVLWLAKVPRRLAGPLG